MYVVAPNLVKYKANRVEPNPATVTNLSCEAKFGGRWVAGFYKTSSLTYLVTFILHICVYLY